MYSINKPKPNTFRSFIDFGLKLIPYFLIYAFFHYFLEMEHIINVGWTFFTIIFFLIPVSIILFLFKLYYLIKNRKSNK